MGEKDEALVLHLHGCFITPSGELFHQFGCPVMDPALGAQRKQRADDLLRVKWRRARALANGEEA